MLAKSIEVHSIYNLPAKNARRARPVQACFKLKLLLCDMVHRITQRYVNSITHLKDNVVVSWFLVCLITHLIPVSLQKLRFSGAYVICIFALCICHLHICICKCQLSNDWKHCTLHHWRRIDVTPRKIHHSRNMYKHFVSIGIQYYSRIFKELRKFLPDSCIWMLCWRGDMSSSIHQKEIPGLSGSFLQC